MVMTLVAIHGHCNFPDFQTLPMVWSWVWDCLLLLNLVTISFTDGVIAGKWEGRVHSFWTIFPRVGASLRFHPGDLGCAQWLALPPSTDFSKMGHTRFSDYIPCLLLQETEVVLVIGINTV